jgi:hypothetical protein
MSALPPKADIRRRDGCKAESYRGVRLPPFVSSRIHRVDGRFKMPYRAQILRAPASILLRREQCSLVHCHVSRISKLFKRGDDPRKVDTAVIPQRDLVERHVATAPSFHNRLPGRIEALVLEIHVCEVRSEAFKRLPSVTLPTAFQISRFVGQAEVNATDAAQDSQRFVDALKKRAVVALMRQRDTALLCRVGCALPKRCPHLS